MIIGKGLIGSSFQDVDQDNVIFFASGVSNSLETDTSQFDREEQLVLSTIANFPTKQFVYFSTCSIYDSSKHDSAYVLHKLHIEEIIKTNCHNFLILRISNAVGKGGNSALLMNYLAASIKQNIPISIYKNAARNLIDVADVKKITIELLDRKMVINSIVNVAYKDNFTILEIIQAFEQHLNVRVKKDIILKGESYSVDISQIDSYFSKSDKHTYLKNLIETYY